MYPGYDRPNARRREGGEYRVEKMTFGKNDEGKDCTVIHYNERIRVGASPRPSRSA